jgi:hypothetical protein
MTVPLLIRCARGAALLLALAARPAASQASTTVAADTAPLALARRLLKTMHSEETIVKAMDAAMLTQRQTNSRLPPTFFDSFSVRAHRHAPELVDSLAPLFARVLSVADLKDLVRFYESPLGQRYATAQTTFALQSGEIGKRWGARLAIDLMKDLVNQGIMPGDGP